MTIKEYIIKNTEEHLRCRRATLKAMNAPEVLLDSIADELARLYCGELRCSGEIELLEEEFRSDELKKGRGGIAYHVFNGNINYFPRAKYGRYIAKGEVK